MHQITAAIVNDRLYEIGRRCRHPFIERTDGVIVSSIDTAAAKGCTPVIEVTFDDDTKITTTLTGVTLCWQPVRDKPRKRKRSASST